MLRTHQRIAKRGFDLVFASLVLVGTSPLLVLAIAATSVDTRAWGVFSQTRVGRDGGAFRVFKVRSMRVVPGQQSTVTASGDPRITRLGGWLRKAKIDELPQFFNVLIGDMSVVGPRPDVPGYADQLNGDNRVVLSVRPGITGPAAVYYRDEEELLAAQASPQRFNDEVLWPSKVRINRDYVENYSFVEDLRLIVDTALPRLRLSRASKSLAGELEDSVFRGAISPSIDNPES